MRDQALHSLSTALAATMTDQMHSDGNREEVREHKEKEGKKKNLYLSSRTVPATVHASLTA